jgi:hypothetical protein
VKWLRVPEEHDFAAAEDYLSLVMPPDDAVYLRGKLAEAETVTHRKAKDILRASGLALLPADSKHVAADLAKVKAGKALSPVLLVRLLHKGHAQPLIIADGYHPGVRLLLAGRERGHPGGPHLGRLSAVLPGLQAATGGLDGETGTTTDPRRPARQVSPTPRRDHFPERDQE